MDMLPSEEQEEIVASVASLLEAKMPVSRVRELSTLADTIDRALLAEVAELGWFTLGLPEELGGVGYGLPEEALLMRELGRHLATGPFLAMILAARIAALSGKSDLAAAIAAGQTVVGLTTAITDLVVTDGALSAEVLSVDGSSVDLLLISTPELSALVDVSGVSGTDRPGIDPTTRISSYQLSKQPVVAVVDEASSHIHLRGIVLAAAQLTGVAEAARNSAALHARERIQFGSPIGVNQAIKHPCAEMAVRCEAAAGQTFFAAMTVDKLIRGEEITDALFQASAAKLVAAEAAFWNGRHDIQIHGGMGFSAENDSHLYVKRAHVLSRVFGDRTHLLADIIAAAPAQ